MTTKDRPKLTREAIVDAAIRVADRDGLAKLSMRNLAKELGFEVMSLYTHVSNKADLHTGMVEHCIDQLETPDIDDTFDWRTALRKHALDLKALFEHHPWSVELWVRSIPGPRRFDLMDWQLAAFAASGLSEHDAHRAYHAFFNHTVGYMLQRHAMTFAGDEAAIGKMIATLDPDRHAHVLHHVDQHRNGHIDDSFEFTLDLLLDSHSPEQRPPAI
ncbi:MAG: TetR/AcrR family transcriptional regulator [Acidimicrobiales bacterium]|nr:MAG: TetR/AcrR family transcriptional regulator [Acidimicrobiales bacterium]